MQQNKNLECKSKAGTDNNKEAVGQTQEMAPGAFKRCYGELMSDLPEIVVLTVSTISGEKTIKALALWDTGASYTTISKAIIDKLGIEPTPPMDDEGEPTTTANMRYLGTTSAKLQIGNISFPYSLFKVMDFDPEGAQHAAGIELPELLIGMDIISQGRFRVDSTSGETILTFEIC